MDVVSYNHADNQRKRINNLYFESESVPTTMLPGAEWYVPSTGKLYKYINDGTSDVWVDAIPGGAMSAIDTQEEFIVGTPSGDYTGSLNTFKTSKGFIAGTVIVVRDNYVMNSSEFNDTDGINIVLTVDAIVGEVLQVISFGRFNIANHYDKTESDIFHRYVPMRIKATEAISALDVVTGSGYNQGEDAIEVIKTVAQTDIAIGIAGVSIANGEFANIVTKGIIENIDTSSWAFGTILYSDALGALTSTKPSGAYQAVAYVVKNHAITGAVMVDIGEPVIPVDLSTYVQSEQEGGVGSLIYNTIKVTQAEYNGLTPDANTAYFIV